MDHSKVFFSGHDDVLSSSIMTHIYVTSHCNGVTSEFLRHGLVSLCDIKVDRIG
jgi:hypothetical protein